MYTVLARRQMADPQPNSCLQLPPNNRRPMSTIIGSFSRCSILQRLPHCRWRQCDSPGRAFLAGKQYPRAVEASLLQGWSDYFRGCRRYYWSARFPVSGCAEVFPWHCCVDCVSHDLCPSSGRLLTGSVRCSGVILIVTGLLIFYMYSANPKG
jgi:hypothetical protein